MRGITKVKQTSCCFPVRPQLSVSRQAFDARSDSAGCSSIITGRRPEVAGPIQLSGFYWSGFLCLVLAVLKLTVERHWSWWRVLLPFWAVVGHDLLYITIGFIWLYIADGSTAEEAVTIRQGHGGYGYQFAALACFAVFVENMLRRIEGQEETILWWLSSGRWEVIFVSGILSIVLQLLFWSDVVDPGDRRTHRG